MLDNEKLMSVLPILRREYDAAVAKHPSFPGNAPEAVCLITEELGELAQEINDIFECVPGAQERALIEAAHVAVTAIRTMEMLKNGGAK